MKARIKFSLVLVITATFFSGKGVCQFFPAQPNPQDQTFTHKDVGIGIKNAITTTHIASGLLTQTGYSATPPLVGLPNCGTALRVEYLQPVVNGCGGSSLWDFTATNDQSLRFSTIHGSLFSPIDVMTLTDFGDVGIGTSNPKQKLHVSGHIQLQDHLVFNGKFVNANVNWDRNGSLNFRSLSTPGDIFSFLTRMTIKGKTGNVGIGTTNPQAHLHVSGPGNQFIDITSTDALGSHTRLMAVTSNGITESQLQFVGRFGLVEPIGGNFRLTILPNGNVGIGTVTPNHLLDVAGTIRGCEVVVELDKCPDYVFEKDYSLMPLGELDTYLTLEKHLPHMLPANQVDAQGWKVGEMSGVMLRSIEENTLYILQLKELLELQQDKIEQLESLLQAQKNELR